MASNIYLISDLHFNDPDMIKLVKENGEKLRPWDTLKDMNEALRENWNSVVKKSKDKVYVLGDIGDIQFFEGLAGKKRLLPGNHDIYSTSEYIKYFEYLYSVRVFVDDMILSHIPIHPLCLNRRFKVNVHGHLHANKLNDPRYFNVSVEMTNFKPIHIDEVRERINKNSTKHNLLEVLYEKLLLR